MADFKIRVTKDYTVFCAGHFITYEGDKCEPLHGHNYRAAAVIEGDLDENAYVFNFVDLKKIMRRTCDMLDHRMLLPMQNKRITVQEDGDSIVVTYGNKRYVFPHDDVVLLPIPNTTAEQLAQWIGGRIAAEIMQQGPGGWRTLEVEVEETFGQSAFCKVALG